MSLFPKSDPPPPRTCINGHKSDRLKGARCPECGANAFKIDRYALSQLSPRDRSALLRQCHLEGEFFVRNAPSGQEEPERREASKPDHEKSAAPAHGPAVILGSSHGDVHLVRGKPKTGLTPAQFDVVKVLLAAGRRGLTGDMLAEESCHSDAVNILARVRRDNVWLSAILFPGTGGRFYRIAWTDDPQAHPQAHP